uniref:Cytochrome c oxidase subunit 2 n=1 Tax=Echinorhynchus truttae TaxID=185727 RepID=K0JA05_9BILA|nr:cytochrome c oxidase subunit II [Echinorhynchus truttae]CCA94463.1 cytochrome oxidase Subunit 2 [Echinorhynchus truttae]
MLNWGGAGMSDGFSSYMEGVVQFNDYIMSLVLFVFWFVVVLVVLEVSWGLGGDREGGGVTVLEFIWTLLPVMLLVFMAYPSLVLLYISEVALEADFSVSVVGHQWYWEYGVKGGSEDSYMSQVVAGDFRLLGVDNRLVLPAFSNVWVGATSSDVIHSWAIPSLGVKIDCIPGRLNYLLLEVLGSGVFYGQCSELCGVMHSFMPIVIEVISVVDYV